MVTVHNMYGSPEHKAWINMKGRCYNKNDKDYNKHYGGRGITVCKEWHKFINFYNDMGKRPKGYTLERIDNDGNYEPSNCKWASRKEQSRNTRRNRQITYNGITKCIADWASEYNVHWSTVHRRIIRKGKPE